MQNIFNRKAQSSFEKTEQDVRRLGDMIEKQVYLVSSPKVSKARAVFQGLTLAIRSQKLHVSIAHALGLSDDIQSHSLEDFNALIATMEGKGSRAADKIKRVLPDVKKMIEAVEEADAGGHPFRVVDAVRRKFGHS